RLRDEFHKIFKARGGVAVAAVVSDSCSGCRTRIRPMVMQQLKRGDVVFCENCRRILYLERPTS
ncbi:MAG TPA: C4-type zinc ribbon domain-containing protein, partial [Thermoanaerobaculia bacterium]